MESSELKIFDRFTFVLGIFIGAVVAAALYLTASLLDKGAEPATENKATQEEIGERLAPVGRVVLLGDAELEAERQAAVAAVARKDTVLTGEQVFNEACYLCHSPPGVPGAPSIDDPAAWAPRIAKGKDVLYDHALHGFQGDAGVMPEKGGRVDLSDGEIRAAVDYMVGQAEK